MSQIYESETEETIHESQHPGALDDKVTATETEKATRAADLGGLQGKDDVFKCIHVECEMSVK